ncbi:YmdB family metallophosphoesterase [Corynebacterium sp. A21]|uniref:YmdB family metallophosphoesterase n=1 Tax=Corynebacterium sp. A21 TaxID=3457318 RepID=UPI003FD3FFAE
MKVLAVGDVVGEEAAYWLAERLPALRAELGVDWVMVNAENCAVTGPSPMNGFGMTSAIVEVLVAGGVDVITGGNHSWDGPEVAEVLAHPQVVRPVNLDTELGQGVCTLTGRDGRKISVINLLSPTAALPDMNAPKPQPLWQAWQQVNAEHELAEVVLLDVHGESPWEKASMAAALDGSITALVGTHTHDATLRGHVLPQGTGLVTELGMTGRLGFTGGGFDPLHFAAAFRGEPLDDLPPYTLAKGEMVLGAVLLEIDPAGRTTGIRRVH